MIILPSTTTEVANELFRLDDSPKAIYCLAASPPILCSDAFPPTMQVRFYVPNVERYRENLMWEHVTLYPCIEQTVPIYYTGYKTEYVPLFFHNNMPWNVELLGYLRYGRKISDVIEEGKYDAIFNVIGDDFKDTIVVPFAVTSISECFESVSQAITVYPNPVTDIVCVRGAHVGAKINIFNDTNEKMLEESAGKYVTRIHVAALPDGVYYVNCNGSIVKIIKQ
ncbi:MAG: T9SS type A sorting domain-containing protein [Muribaculaceae bacterium]